MARTVYLDEGINSWRKARAYWLYCALVLSGTLAILLVCPANGYREHMARGWILLMAVLSGPAAKMFSWWRGAFVTLPPLGLSILGALWLSYNKFGYSPTGPVSTLWLVATIATYVVMGGLAGLVVSRLTGIHLGADESRSELG